MSSAYAADELADHLDHVLPPQDQAVPQHDSDPLVDTALRLARGPHPSLSLEQVARIETLILARVIPARTRRPIRTIIQWAAAACLIVALITMGTASVSAESLPGDTFYPVKRFVERGRLALSSDTGEIDLRLQFADRRLDEFEMLLDRGKINLDPLNDAIEDMNSALALVEKGNGSRDQLAQELVKLSSRQVQLTEKAENRVDASTAGELHDAATEAEQVAQEARDLLERPASILPNIRPTETFDTLIPQEMRDQASSQRLPTLTLDHLPMSEPPVVILPPASPAPTGDDPVLVGTPPDKKNPPIDDPTRTPEPTRTVEPPTKTPPIDKPTSTEPPTATPSPTAVDPMPTDDYPTSTTEPPTATPSLPVSTEIPTDAAAPPANTPIPPTVVPELSPTADDPVSTEIPTDAAAPPANTPDEPVVSPEPPLPTDEPVVDVQPTVDVLLTVDPVEMVPSVPVEVSENDVSIELLPTETPIPTESGP